MAAKLTVGISIITNMKLSINEVESGLNCNCICEGCGARLVAKLCRNRADHFAHYNTVECDWARETALHEEGKKMFLENSAVMLPNGELFEYDYAENEVILPGLRADVVLYKGYVRMIVEVFVSHKVTPKKENAIRANNIRCLEIDLSHTDRDISAEKLKTLMFDIKWNRRLIDAYPIAQASINETDWLKRLGIMAMIAACVIVLIKIIKRFRNYRNAMKKSQVHSSSRYKQKHNYSRMLRQSGWYPMCKHNQLSTY